MSHQRRDQIKETVDKNRRYLVENIDIKTSLLWERLIELDLYTGEDAEYIKVSVSYKIFLQFWH